MDITKKIWAKNMLKQIKYILNDRSEIMSELDESMCIDEFLDLKDDIETILDEVIEELKNK